MANRTLLIPSVDAAFLHPVSLHLMLPAPPFPHSPIRHPSREGHRQGRHGGKGHKAGEGGRAQLLHLSFVIASSPAVDRGAVHHGPSLPSGSPSPLLYLHPLEKEPKPPCMPPLSEESQQRAGRPTHLRPCLSLTTAQSSQQMKEALALPDTVGGMENAQAVSRLRSSCRNLL